MSRVYIREARSTDADELAVLELRFRSSLTQVRGGAEWLSTHEAVDWATSLQHTGTSIFVAQDLADRELCGLILVQEDKEAARVELLCSPSPGDAISVALLTQVRTAAALRGKSRIVAYAFPGNRVEKNMYEEVGMKAVSLKMEGFL